MRKGITKNLKKTKKNCQMVWYSRF